MKILRIFVALLSKNIEVELDEKKSEWIKIWDNVILKNENNLVEWVVLSVFNLNKKVELESEIKFVRKVNELDLEKIEKIREKEKKMMESFKEEYKKHKLELEPISSILSFDEKIILFTFSAENRVDFRDLLKSLANKLKKRIQLKHIWSRDRAALVWWVWICGNEVCCSKFLKKLPSVTIDTVKTQDLIYKSTDNLSWLCWKLKCCLNYEVKQYQEIKKNMPKIWTEIIFENWAKWKIIWMDVFNQKIKIKTEDRFQILNYSEIKDLIKK